jgi:hypothetical protein
MKMKIAKAILPLVMMPRIPFVILQSMHVVQEAVRLQLPLVFHQVAERQVTVYDSL